MIVFVALLPAYTLSIFYRSCLSVIAGPVMADLAIGPRELGFLGSAWFIAFAAAQFPVGWALDRLGPRRTVAAAMTLGSAGAVLFSLAPGIWSAGLAMALIGIGCSPVFMAGLFLFARTAPERFAALSSVFIGIGSLGNLIGATPLALAAERFGWRGAMLGIAIVFVASTLLAALVLRDPPRAVDASGRQEGLLQGLRSIAAIRPLWLLAPLVLVGYAIVVAARGLWIAPYLSEVHGYDAVAAGNAALLMAAAMVVAAFGYGWLQIRIGLFRPLVGGGSVLAAAGFAGLAWFGADSGPGAVALFGFIGAAGFTYALLMAHARVFFPAHLTGRGMTCVNFVFIAGAALVAAGSGWFIAAQKAAGLGAAATYANLHWVFAALMVASTIVYLLAPERPVQAR